jgi:hypothetical protein
MYQIVPLNAPNYGLSEKKEKMDQHIFYYVIGSQISIESSNSAF